MFTGIIEEIGKVKSFSQGSDACIIEICAERVLEETKIGDSISVNGICLTVIGLGIDSFTADVMPVTIEKSSLKGVAPGMEVNLERALTPSTRMGGHIVSGHVDAVGTIISVKTLGNAVLYGIEVETDVIKFMIPEGSIAIDGISLTIAELSDRVVTVSIIPTTRKETVLQYKEVGDKVNIESDVIGKYVWYQTNNEREESKITKSFLAENGFI